MAVFLHILGNIFVADRCLFIADAQLVERLVEAHVRHDGGDDLGIAELAALLQEFGGEVKDMVAVDDISFLIHRQAAVGVAVEGKAHIQIVRNHKAAQVLDMG